MSTISYAVFCLKKKTTSINPRLLCLSEPDSTSHLIAVSHTVSPCIPPSHNLSTSPPSPPPLIASLPKQQLPNTLLGGLCSAMLTEHHQLISRSSPPPRHRISQPPAQALGWVAA